MAGKSGGDIFQGNAAQQGNLSAQDLNALGVGGVGAVGALSDPDWEQARPDSMWIRIRARAT